MKIINNNLSKPVKALLLCSSLCLGFVMVRSWQTGNITYLFLLWNLFLAWIPLVTALKLKKYIFAETSPKLRYFIYFGLAGLWLLFFPNAPYIITDLIHLNGASSSKNWFDPMIIFTFAFTGLSTGLLSLHYIHLCTKKVFNGTAGWTVIISSSILSGYGVYLGRVLRWNSWDIFTNPISLFKEIILQLTNQTAQMMTLFFALLVFCIYLVFVSFIHDTTMAKIIKASPVKTKKKSLQNTVSVFINETGHLSRHQRINDL